MRLRSLSEFIIEVLEVNLREYQMIDAKPAGAREEKPHKNH